MLPGFVKYKDIWLHKSSDAYWLLENGLLKRLDEHLNLVNRGKFNPIVRKK